MAAIEALRALDPGVPVIVRSDSQYLVKTMNDGWRRTKNLDLWQELDREVSRHGKVRFEWVRGHAGDALNEEADALAREATRSAAKGLTPRRPDAVVGAPSSAAGRAAQGAARPAAEDADDLAAAELRPLLGSGERIARCAACRRSFVARDGSELPSGDNGERYCALVACQLSARSGRAR